ncbi:hypothetical protein BO82DRAFT_388162 [Aspergillus uvarum CBS 121591]|uniref:Uncharacterized protein n=1 Tax=Aspergillus uvarum CBS 121591 TaxID=1448315 RepID=A0A319CRP1_9EURO|nr:hypothetical protein BO82DRAFT_388162 [Aspergillus uvarum CBS 121591]PYH87119.1 hypothetical protein BO82DRAFT_388162 [Aspergillus uvarum CBS 121591]
MTCPCPYIHLSIQPFIMHLKGEGVCVCGIAQQSREAREKLDEGSSTRRKAKEWGRTDKFSNRPEDQARIEVHTPIPTQRLNCYGPRTKMGGREDGEAGTWMEIWIAAYESFLPNYPTVCSLKMESYTVVGGHWDKFRLWQWPHGPIWDATILAQSPWVGSRTPLAMARVPVVGRQRIVKAMQVMDHGLIGWLSWGKKTGVIEVSVSLFESASFSSISSSFQAEVTLYPHYRIQTDTQAAQQTDGCKCPKLVELQMRLRKWKT